VLRLAETILREMAADQVVLPHVIDLRSTTHADQARAVDCPCQGAEPRCRARRGVPRWLPRIRRRRVSRPRWPSVRVTLLERLTGYVNCTHLRLTCQ
jgi:hypothetical protein